MVFRVEEVEGQRIDKLAVTFEQRREERERNEAGTPSTRRRGGRRSCALRRPLQAIYGTNDAKMSVGFELETVCV